MARYRLFIKPPAAKEIEALPVKNVRRSIFARIQTLSTDPRPYGSEEVVGEDRYRVRQGEYRIVYSVDDSDRSVTIAKVAHRKEVYR